MAPIPDTALIIWPFLLPTPPPASIMDRPEGFGIDVGELTLQAKLAEGAYGVVWRGRHEGRDVAVKVQVRTGWHTTWRDG